VTVIYGGTLMRIFIFNRLISDSAYHLTSRCES
jgi:hypothetical protein